MPPHAVTAALPVPPLHFTFVTVVVAVKAGGWVIVTVAVPVQPFLSFTVTVYVPAERPVALELLPPEGAQVYVNGEVPPVTVAEALPVAPPLHFTLAVTLALTLSDVVVSVTTTADESQEPSFTDMV